MFMGAGSAALDCFARCPCQHAGSGVEPKSAPICRRLAPLPVSRPASVLREIVQASTPSAQELQMRLAVSGWTAPADLPLRLLVPLFVAAPAALISTLPTSQPALPSFPGCPGHGSTEGAGPLRHPVLRRPGLGAVRWAAAGQLPGSWPPSSHCCRHVSPQFATACPPASPAAGPAIVCRAPCRPCLALAAGSFVSGLYTPTGDLDLSIEGRASWCAGAASARPFRPLRTRRPTLWQQQPLPRGAVLAGALPPLMLLAYAAAARCCRRDDAGRPQTVTVEEMGREMKVRFLRVSRGLTALYPLLENNEQTQKPKTKQFDVPHAPSRNTGLPSLRSRQPSKVPPTGSPGRRRPDRRNCAAPAMLPPRSA